MLSSVITKVRALIDDALKNGREVHTYVSSKIFTLTESNVSAISAVTNNGAALDSGESYSYSSTTNKITMVGTFAAGDEFEFAYTYYAKYSDTELTDWIRASLVYLSLYDDCKDFELEDDGESSYYFEPTPSNKELDLIAMVTAILINPDWSEYKLPNVTVKFPRTQDKETRIARLIKSVKSSNGWTGLIDLED